MNQASLNNIKTGDRIYALITYKNQDVLFSGETTVDIYIDPPFDTITFEGFDWMINEFSPLENWGLEPFSDVLYCGPEEHIAVITDSKDVLNKYIDSLISNIDNQKTDFIDQLNKGKI